MNIFIFSYGSLMNPVSRAKTLSGKRLVMPAHLRGYQRKINAPVNGYLYLNIVPRPFCSTDGVIIGINQSELLRLRVREAGYSMIEVTTDIDPTVDGIIYAFVAPDHDYPELFVPQSYLDTCLARIAAEQQESWIRNTIIVNPIINDRENPVYVNAA